MYNSGYTVSKKYVNAELKPNRSLYVTNLRAEIDQDELYSAFSTHGSIESIRLMNGFAYIRYDKKACAINAKESKDGKPICNEEGRLLKIEFEFKRKTVKDVRNEPSYSLYILNKPPEMTSEHIQNVLGRFGQIHKITMKASHH